MNTKLMNMPNNRSNYTCIHEELIQNQSLKIAELEAKSEFKEKRLDEMDKKIDNINETLNSVSKDINKLLLQSKQDDKELELRLQAIENQLAFQEKARKDDREKTNLYLGVITVIIAIITFYFAYLH